MKSWRLFSGKPSKENRVNHIAVVSIFFVSCVSLIAHADMQKFVQEINQLASSGSKILLAYDSNTNGSWSGRFEEEFREITVYEVIAKTGEIRGALNVAGYRGESLAAPDFYDAVSSNRELKSIINVTESEKVNCVPEAPIELCVGKVLKKSGRDSDWKIAYIFPNEKMKDKKMGSPPYSKYPYMIVIKSSPSYVGQPFLYLNYTVEGLISITTSTQKN